MKTKKNRIIKPVNNSRYPLNANKCPVCKHSIKNSQIILNFGLLEKTGKKQYGYISGINKYKLFMSVVHHQGYSMSSVDVVDINGTQIDLMFCSTECLKQFMNKYIDELEIVKTRRENERNQKKNA